MYLVVDRMEPRLTITGRQNSFDVRWYSPSPTHKCSEEWSRVGNLRAREMQLHLLWDRSDLDEVYRKRISDYI